MTELIKGKGCDDEEDRVMNSKSPSLDFVFHSPQQQQQQQQQ